MARDESDGLHHAEAEDEDELEVRRSKSTPAPRSDMPRRGPSVPPPGPRPATPPTPEPPAESNTWLPEPLETTYRMRILGDPEQDAPTPRARSEITAAGERNSSPLTLADTAHRAAAPPRARVPQPGERHGDEPPTTGATAKPATRSLGSGCAWVGALVLVIVAACALLTYGAISGGISGLSGWVPRFPGLAMVTPTTIVDISRPAVIEQIRTLNRLETTQYTVEKVIPGESTGPLPPFTTDKILFVAHGEVVAGVDLSKLSESDIKVSEDGTTVTINLPAAEILSSRLDNDKSYVYNRDTGIFAKSDTDLETNVRRTAESEITKSALEDGILQRAQADAQNNLRSFLMALGYTTVNFGTQRAPAATPTP